MGSGKIRLTESREGKNEFSGHRINDPVISSAISIFRDGQLIQIIDQIDWSLIQQSKSTRPISGSWM